jgi:hypothetical protein
MSRMKKSLNETGELAAKWLTATTENFLKEYASATTQAKMRYSLSRYCAWRQMNDAQLVAEYKSAEDKEQWSKTVGKQIVEWYNLLLRTGYKVNSARSAASSVMAFYRSTCRPVVVEKKKIAKAQIAENEHHFSQAELQRMFMYGDMKQKAILATGVSLGWGSEDFLALKRADIEKYVNKAVKENLQFIGFKHNRAKTGEVSYSFLIPEAIQTLHEYLENTPQTELLWGDMNNNVLNYQLNSMVEKAGVVKTGEVHFHLLRKFVYGNLCAAGLNEHYANLLVGKSVPSDKLTYLLNDEETLLENYQRAYSRLTLYGNGNGTRAKVGELEERNKKLEDQVETLNLALDIALKRLEQLDPKFKAKGEEMRRILAQKRAKPN